MRDVAVVSFAQMRSDPERGLSEVLMLVPTVAEAIELMRQHQLGCLPVIEDNLLVGIVTVL